MSSFLDSIKAALNIEAQKAEEKEVNALTRTQDFVKDFRDVNVTHPTELKQVANQLYSLEQAKDNFLKEQQKVSEARKAEERLVCAVESISNQIQVVAEEILDLEEAIIADKEATVLAESASKDGLATLAKCNNRKFLEIARAKRAEKTAKTTV